MADSSSNFNPESLGLYLHAGDVPVDAKDTPFRVEHYTDRSHRTLALNMNAQQLLASTARTYHLVIYAGAWDCWGWG